ncbi:MAG TPA: ATP-binding protein [Candidatus Paceibacterota bacterium]|nr:ATP-binding protein [Candidatus Paceibacterota bacterium]
MPWWKTPNPFERPGEAGAHRRRIFPAIRLRLMVIVVVAIVPALGFILSNVLTAENQVIKESQDSTRVLVRSATDNVDRVVESTEGLMVALARTTEVKEGLANQCGPFFAELLSQYPFYANIGLADNNGHVVCAAQAGKEGVDVSKEPFFTSAISNRALSLGDYRASQLTGLATLTLGYPVMTSKGALRSVIFIELNLANLSQVVSQLALSRGSELIMFDRNGRILVRRPGFQQWVGMPMRYTPLVQTILAATSSDDTVEAAGADDVMRDFVFRQIGSNFGGGAYLAIGTPRDELLAEVQINLNQNLIVLSALAIVALALAWFIGDRLIVRQVNADEAVLMAISDGMFVVDRRGRISLINRSFTDLLGLDFGDVAGRPWTEVISVVDSSGTTVPSEKLPVTYAILTGKAAASSLANEFYCVRRDHGNFPVVFAASPIVVGLERTGTIVVFRDVTREKEVDKAKTEFVSLASHQLRTPLSTINWYTEMLLDGDAGPVGEEQKKYLEEIYRGSQRMVKLVNTLLNISRLELGTFIVEPEPMNVIDLARSVLKDFAPQISEKKLEVVERFAKDTPILDADPKLFRIIVQNLLSNAVKYTDVGGKIVLSIAVDNDPDRNRLHRRSLFLSVTDNGFGIPKDQQNGIFGKLYRADNAKEHDPDGTGLGLYIVKNILTQVGGVIWFESEEGRGTTFSVLLPIEGMTKRAGAKSLV